MPQVKGAPEELNKLLEEVYASALKTYKGDKGKASAVAWAAAKKSGWKQNKDGNWVKNAEITQVIALSDDFKTNPEFEIDEPEIDENGEIVLNEKYAAILLDVTLLGAKPPEAKTLPPIDGSNVVGFSEKGAHFHSIRIIKEDFTEPKGINEINLICQDPVELREIPILPETRVRGMPFDLEKIVENFYKVSNIHKPRLTIGHNDIVQQASEYPSFGEMVKCYIKTIKDNAGNMVKMIFGDFVNVPRAIAQAIKNKTYSYISAELYPYFPLCESAENIKLKLSELNTVSIYGKEENAMPEFTQEQIVQFKETADKATQALIDSLLSEQKKITEENIKLKENTDIVSKEKAKFEEDLSKNKVAFEEELSKIKSEKEILESKTKEQELQLSEISKITVINKFKSTVEEMLKPTETNYGIGKELREQFSELCLKVDGLVKLSEEDSKTTLSTKVLDFISNVIKNKDKVIVTLGEKAPGSTKEKDMGSEDKDASTVHRMLKEFCNELSVKSGKIVRLNEGYPLFNKYECIVTNEAIIEAKNNKQFKNLNS